MDQRTKAIVERLLDYINSKARYPGDGIELDSLGSFVAKLNKKDQKLIKRVGFTNFLKSHSEFSVIDTRVYSTNLSSNEEQSVETNEEKNSLSHVRPAAHAIEETKSYIEKNHECTVCCEYMEVFAFGPCFHPICYRCSTKLRVLCDDKHCTACRTVLTQVVFTFDLNPLDELKNLNDYISEQKYGIRFQNKEIHNKYKKLLQHPCKYCPERYNLFDDLKKHMQKKHGEYFCDICVKSYKIFTHERETYSTMQLERHIKFGDGGGSRGHPPCEYCDIPFVDRDALYSHMARHHFTCHLCDHDGRNVFYPDRNELWKHFGQTHVICNHKDCYLHDPSSVFLDRESLETHKFREHGQNITNFKTKANNLNGTSSGVLGGSSSLISHRSSFLNTNGTIDASGGFRCLGTVLAQHLTIKYGFIEPDWGQEFFDNIYFNLESLGLNLDEELTHHIRAKDRVIVYALPSKQNSRSSYRAETVMKCLGNEDLDSLGLLRTRPQAAFGSSSRPTIVSSTSTPSLRESAPPASEDFPALPVGGPSSSSIFGESSNGSASSWLTVASKPVKQTRTKQQEKPIKAKEKEANKLHKHINIPIEGYGWVHPSLTTKYGFIKPQHSTSYDDNIYFHLSNVTKAMSITYFVDGLQKITPPNSKVGYILDVDTKPRAGSKSKYIAKLVWRYGFKDGETPRLPKNINFQTGSFSNIINLDEDFSDNSFPASTPTTTAANGKENQNPGSSSARKVKEQPSKQQPGNSTSTTTKDKSSTTSKTAAAASKKAVNSKEQPPDQSASTSSNKTKKSANIVNSLPSKVETENKPVVKSNSAVSKVTKVTDSKPEKSTANKKDKKKPNNEVQAETSKVANKGKSKQKETNGAVDSPSDYLNRQHSSVSPEVAVSTSSTTNLTNGYRTSSISSLDDAPGLVCDDSDSIFSLESLEEADFFNEPVNFDSAVNSPQPPTPAVASVENRAAMTPPVSGKNSPRTSSKQSFAEATHIKNPVLQQIFKSAQQSKKTVASPVAKEPSSNQVKPPPARPSSSASIPSTNHSSVYGNDISDYGNFIVYDETPAPPAAFDKTVPPPALPPAVAVVSPMRPPAAPVTTTSSPAVINSVPLLPQQQQQATMSPNHHHMMNGDHQQQNRYLPPPSNQLINGTVSSPSRLLPPPSSHHMNGTSSPNRFLLGIGSLARQELQNGDVANKARIDGYDFLSVYNNDMGAAGDYHQDDDGNHVSFPATVGSVTGKSNAHNDEVFKHLMEACCADNFHEFLFDLKTDFDIYDIDGLSSILVVNFEKDEEVIVYVDPYRNPQGSFEQSEDITEILDPVEIRLPSVGFNPDVLLNLAMEKYIRKVNQDMFVVRGAAHYVTIFRKNNETSKITLHYVSS